MKTKMKMKRKIHPNVPNVFIAEYSYIFAPFFESIVCCCTIVFDLAWCSMVFVW